MRICIRHRNFPCNHPHQLNQISAGRQWILFLPVKDFIEFALERRVKVIQDSGPRAHELRTVHLNRFCLRRKDADPNSKPMDAKLASSGVQSHQLRTRHGWVVARSPPDDDVADRADAARHDDFDSVERPGGLKRQDSRRKVFHQPLQHQQQLQLQFIRDVLIPNTRLCAHGSNQRIPWRHIYLVQQAPRLFFRLVCRVGISGIVACRFFGRALALGLAHLLALGCNLALLGVLNLSSALCPRRNVAALCILCPRILARLWDRDQMYKYVLDEGQREMLGVFDVV